MPRSDDEIERLATRYDTTDTTTLEGEEVELEPARDVMVSRSIRFDRQTMDRLRAAAAQREVGVTQLMRQWLVDRLDVEESGVGREQIAEELERLARQVRAAAG